MFARLSFATIALAALTYALALNAQETAAPKNAEAGQLKENLSNREQILARQYQEFEQQLLRLKQRLERSGKQEDRDRALVLDRVLEFCKEKSISVQFEQMVEILKSKELRSVPDIKQALERSNQIAEELRLVITMLREDTRAQVLRDERLKLEAFLKDLEATIQAQKSVQGLTDNNKTDKNELKNIQNKVTQKTAELADKLAGKDGKGGKEGKNTKGDPKAAGKNGDKAGEAKDDGEKVASKSPEAQAKEGGEGKEPKGGAKSGEGDDPKSGKGKEGGESQAKGGKGPEGKESTSKEGKGSEGAQAKEGGKSPEGKQGGAKEGSKEGKPGDPAQAKAGGEKSGAGEKPPSEAKSGKGSEGKSGEAKGSKSGKPGESGQAKEGSASGKPPQGESKPGKSSSGQSQAKDSGSPPSGPMPPSNPPGQQASNKGDKKDGSQPKQPGGPAPETPPTGKKQIEDANYKQQEAEAKIDQNKNDDASGKQDGAIKDLEKAKKDLEKLLRQIREEEVERLLAALQVRCEKMLAMQIQVLSGTESVNKAVVANDDKQPNRTNKQDSLKLSDNEGDIVTEANKAIELLEADGTAIAFPEVFQQVREDMKHVQRRLGVSDVAQVTQGIEQDIIDSLKEMIEALKKAKKDLADSKSNPSPPGPPPPPQDQKLLEKIAELKMIRSMQIRVNGRTQTYGKMYQGEQTQDMNIRRELHNLSERQERIFEITNRMAKGDNQ